MTKKEQIYEIAKYVCNACEFGIYRACRKSQTDVKSCSLALGTARRIYNAGYRKVLFDTENGKAVDVCQYAPWKLVEGYTEREIGKARKETAKEILQEWADDNSSMGLDNTFVKNIAKKYGVEVEE